MTDAQNAPPAAIEKGRSLWQDAFRRLRKNRLAVVGGVVTVLVALSAVLAPWLAPFEPEHQESQYSNRPPRLQPHLIKESLAAFQVGEPSNYPEEAAGKSSTRVEFLFDPAQETRYQVGVKKGKVRRLILVGGEELPPGSVVEPSLAEERFFERNEENQAGSVYAFRRLSIGEECPEELRDPQRDRQGYLVEVILKVAEPLRLVVLFERDRVVRIDLSGKEVESYSLRSWWVQNIWLDGEVYEHRHLLGTDHLGRDLLSRLLYGGQISLLVGVVATLVSLLIGVVYGASSGYAGGRTDQFLMRVVDILYALPYMFLVILLLVFFGRNIVILFIALGAVQWLTMSRIVRGQVLSLKQKEFIEAARACGAGHPRILFTHLIPNVLGVVAVYTTLTVPAVILQEAFLSFIGLKVEHQGRDLESWGSLTAFGRESLGPGGENWWLLVFPAVTLAISLLCMNFLGDGLRDALDPRQKGRT